MSEAAWVPFHLGDPDADHVFAQVRAGVTGQKHLAGAIAPQQAALLPENAAEPGK